MYVYTKFGKLRCVLRCVVIRVLSASSLPSSSTCALGELCLELCGVAAAGAAIVVRCVGRLLLDRLLLDNLLFDSTLNLELLRSSVKLLLVLDDFVNLVCSNGLPAYQTDLVVLVLCLSLLKAFSDQPLLLAVRVSLTPLWHSLLTRAITLR